MNKRRKKKRKEKQVKSGKIKIKVTRKQYHWIVFKETITICFQMLNECKNLLCRLIECSKGKREVTNGR